MLRRHVNCVIIIIIIIIIITRCRAEENNDDDDDYDAADSVAGLEWSSVKLTLHHDEISQSKWWQVD